MAGYSLRLFDDRLAPKTALALGDGARCVLYVMAGDLGLDANNAQASLAANSAWYGGAARLRAGAAGAHILRFELVAGEGAVPDDATPGVESRLVLARPLVLDPAAQYLIRCDRVAFPPGGVAYTHTHQGPGLRRLVMGRIRIETQGTVHAYAPGEAWFETGPDPVFAAGSETEATAFVRVMVLPASCLGRSSIRYVRPEDQDKPKPQTYQIYIDTPVALPGGPA